MGLGTGICGLVGVSACSAERRIKAAAAINATPAHADTSFESYDHLLVFNFGTYFPYFPFFRRLEARNATLMKVFLRGPALRRAL